MSDEIGSQSVQQRCIRGRVGVTEIIHGLDNAAAQQVIPDPIGLRPREERILIGRGPAGGRFEAIDPAGSLVLRLPTGKTTTIAAGDVFMLPSSGKAS